MNDPPDEPVSSRRRHLSVEWFKSLSSSEWVWYVSNTKSNEGAAEASAFVYGYGELFKYSQGGLACCSTRAMPSYLFFLVEMAHTVLKSIILVTITDAGTQSILIICVECISFLLFVIQRPFAQRGLNLDVTIGKAVTLLSFVILSYGSDKRSQQVILANLVVLYFILGLQVLRQMPPVLRLLRWLVDRRS